ncbi:MAG TPA: hypothetical protein VMJ34_05650 [Bryobacteraceae bacterium]|nr:hypothetical protein [Bryobacteraceae bacterium]
MKTLWKGFALGLVQCLLVLSISGKLLYDRSTCPRVWVRTGPYDPSLPIRGRYLALQLAPSPGDPYYTRTVYERVLFFVPEHALAFESERPQLWVEVTIPHKGPPRPIQLALRKDGRLEPIPIP